MLDAIAKGRAGGNGNMPAQIFEGEEAEAVAEFVAVASGGELEPAEWPAAAVHPARSGNSARTRLRFRRCVRKDVVRIGARAGPNAWEMPVKRLLAGLFETATMPDRIR